MMTVFRVGRFSPYGRFAVRLGTIMHHLVKKCNPLFIENQKFPARDWPEGFFGKQDIRLGGFQKPYAFSVSEPEASTKGEASTGWAKATPCKNSRII